MPTVFLARLPLITSLAVSSISGCGGGSTQPADGRPNIVFVLADDLGYGELGSYGQPLIETPHLDRLAHQGMRFTQHYSGSPVCAPSRAVLLTGLHSGHAYIRGNDEMPERGEVWSFAKVVENPALEGQRPLPAGTRTLGAWLKNAGYKTALVGKWGLGGPLSEGAPNLQGFDFFFGFNCQRQAHTYYPRHLWRNGQKVWLDNRLVPPGTKLPVGADAGDPSSYADFELQQYAPELMLTEAVDFIERHQSGPFFLLFASPIPHVPLQAPRRWTEHYIAQFGDEVPYTGDRGYFPHRYPHAAYAAMVSYLDEQVGVLVAKLEELGLREKTLVLFSSDNGPSFNGGTDSLFFNSAKPFKSEQGWGKGSLQEGGIRVPLIANWPGRVEPGAVSEHLSAFQDVLPTLSEIAGIPPPGKIDGISFAPALLGRSGQQQHRYLYWEFPEYGGWQAVRWGSWKGIRRNIHSGNLEIELYDLQADPREQNNLAPQHPDVVARIAEIMVQEHVPSTLESFHFLALDRK